MLKRALCGGGATFAVAAVLAFTVSPISPSVAWAAITAKEIVEKPNTPAPRHAAKARKILRADVTKLSRDYAHKRFRAVCADMTKRERKQLGGTRQCTLKIALVNAFVPIKKFTIVAAKLSKHNAQAAVSLYVNGNKKHLVHAVVRWEGGTYRLDSQSGWHPAI